MKNSEIINYLLFDYELLGKEEIIDCCKTLPRKLIRWLGINHPDNRIRKIFFEITHIKIGEGTVINLNFLVSDGYEKLLEIGKRVAISPNVTIICESAPNNSLLTKNNYVKNKLICERKVIIEDDVWIGTNSVILPGIRVGRESIIGAGSIVTRDIPANSIVAGNPAKVIRKIVQEQDGCA